jgi:hypothetical protein
MGTFRLMTRQLCPVQQRQCAPYAYSGAHVRIASSPFFMVFTPSSQPLITFPVPRLNLKGSLRSREESNFVPSSSVPT